MFRSLKIIRVPDRELLIITVCITLEIERSHPVLKHHALLIYQGKEHLASPSISPPILRNMKVRPLFFFDFKTIITGKREKEKVFLRGKYSRLAVCNSSALSQTVVF